MFLSHGHLAGGLQKLGARHGWLRRRLAIRRGAARLPALHEIRSLAPHTPSPGAASDSGASFLARAGPLGSGGKAGKEPRVSAMDLPIFHSELTWGES